MSGVVVAVLAINSLTKLSCRAAEVLVAILDIPVSLN